MESDSTEAIMRRHGIRLAGTATGVQSAGTMDMSYDVLTQVALASAAQPDSQSDSSASTIGGLLMSNSERLRELAAEEQPDDGFGAEVLGPAANRTWRTCGGGTERDNALRYRRRSIDWSTTSNDGDSTTSSLLMALGEHPDQLRRQRAWRIFRIKVRFIGMARRVLRQQAVERVLAAFFEARGFDEHLVAWLLTWHREPK